MAHAHYDTHKHNFGTGSNPIILPNRGTARPPCRSLEALTTLLLEDIEAAEHSTVPECTTSEIALALSALVPLHRPNIGPYAEGGEHDLPAEFKTNWIASGKDGKKEHPQATVQAIVYAGDHEARQTVQRAASRGIIAAIEKADGFKYSFNNAWAAKDDDGMRFSYICQDSTQNKDRHANGFTRTQKHLKGAGERGPRKETFDCKGSVSVKCSVQRGSLEVFYRHYAIHPKVKERKPAKQQTQKLREEYRPPGYQVPQSQGCGETRGPSAKPAQSQHQNSYQDEDDTGGLFGKLKKMKFAYVDPPQQPKPQGMAEVNSSQASNIGRPLKRKREDETIYARPSGKLLSLADILKQSQTANPSPKTKPKPETPNPNARPPHVNYDLPSWEMPPRAPTPKQQQPTPTYQASNHPPGYQQPYQPHATQQTPTPSSSYPPPPTHQYPPPPPRQEYFGLPKDHPNGQGLFTTMKPVPKGPLPSPTQYPGFVAVAGTPPQARAKISCTNCRFSRKRCDEARPLCTPCTRAGRYDCQYETASAYTYPQSAPSLSPSPGYAPMAPMQGYPQAVVPSPQQQAEVPREESPDPWFPKR